MSGGQNRSNDTNREERQQQERKDYTRDADLEKMQAPERWPDPPAEKDKKQE